jgi:signal transduction histidine kinase
VWRDWALVAVLASASVLELLLGEDRTWHWLVLAVSLVVALTLLWRRTRSLAAVAVGFGTLIAFDVARIFLIGTPGLLTIAALLVLPYALFRWGSGREAAVGLGLILAWLGVTHVADPTATADVVGAYGFFLFPAAVGAAIRFNANTRIRDIEQATLRQRNELARELHDAVGHHVSAIVIQAQAGRALAASHPTARWPPSRPSRRPRRARRRRCAQWSGPCATGRNATSPRNQGWPTSNSSPAASAAGRAWTCRWPATSPS